MPQSKAPLALAFDLPFDEAIVAALARAVILPDEYYGVLQGVARARAVSVAGLTSLSQIQAIIDAVGEALGNGTTFADFVAGVKDEQLTLSKGRLDNIFRTNIQDAYGSGRYEQQKANFDSRPYLMYDAINDSRTRPTHRKMDGYIAKHDDPIWARWTPPCGYRCRCGQIALSAKEARARGFGVQETPNVQPDDGWDYDRRESFLGGIEAAKRKLESQPASELQRAAIKHLEEAAKLANEHKGL